MRKKCLQYLLHKGSPGVQLIIAIRVSKIKNNVDYQPSKSATMAMVLALKLPLDEAEELMAKAGYTFSTALIQDLVVKFFIQEGIFDVDAVNVELYKLGKKPLTNQRVSS